MADRIKGTMSYGIGRSAPDYGVQERQRQQQINQQGQQSFMAWANAQADRELRRALAGDSAALQREQMAGVDRRFDAQQQGFRDYGAQQRQGMLDLEGMRQAGRQSAQAAQHANARSMLGAQQDYGREMQGMKRQQQLGDRDALWGRQDSLLEQKLAEEFAKEQRARGYQVEDRNLALEDRGLDRGLRYTMGGLDRELQRELLGARQEAKAAEASEQARQERIANQVDLTSRIQQIAAMDDPAQQSMAGGLLVNMVSASEDPALVDWVKQQLLAAQEQRDAPWTSQRLWGHAQRAPDYLRNVKAGEAAAALRENRQYPIYPGAPAGPEPLAAPAPAPDADRKLIDAALGHLWKQTGAR